jgi:hypothetical protein
VEAERTETAAVTVKTVEATKMVEATKTAAVMVKTATMAEVTEMAAAVMTTADKVAIDVTDGKGGGRQHRREHWFISSVSEVNIMWNITAGFDDSVLDGVKILGSLLEFSGSECYKLGGRHSRLRRNHVRCFGKIK